MNPTRTSAIFPVITGVLGFSASISLLLFLNANAGDLEPSAPPGPTMKTLDEVEPRIPITSVPYTIDEPGSYYLTGNLTSSDSGIYVRVNDVTIDLMGYTLACDGGHLPYGILISDLGNDLTNVEIRNGTVRDFGGSGIYSGTGRRHRVINVRVESCGENGIILYGEGHLVKDCAAAENGQVGIDVGPGSTVTGCICYNNQSRGIDTGAGCTVSGNTVYGNHSDGINADDSCTVSGNTADGNLSDGIVASLGSTVSGNTVNGNNHDGISVDYGCTVIGNTASENNQSEIADRAGIRVSSGCTVKGNTLRANRENNICVAYSSNAIEENLVTGSGYGIKFNADGSFYANNRASDNDFTDYYTTAGTVNGGGNYSF